MISVWNLDLKNVPRLHLREARYFTRKIYINGEIQELEQGKTYKYLGIEEGEDIQHKQMKERLKHE